MHDVLQNDSLLYLKTINTVEWGERGQHHFTELNPQRLKDTRQDLNAY